MAKKKVMHCSFCGRTEAQGATLLPSPTDDACICVDCIETAASMLGMIDPEDEQQGAVVRARAKNRLSGNGQKEEDKKPIPKPHEIKAFLDQYII